MNILTETKEIKALSEQEAQEIMEKFRNEADEKGYSVASSGYTHKTKKSKGEIIDEAWVVKIKVVYASVWDY